MPHGPSVVVGSWEYSFNMFLVADVCIILSYSLVALHHRLIHVHAAYVNAVVTCIFFHIGM